MNALSRRTHDGLRRAPTPIRTGRSRAGVGRGGAGTLLWHRLLGGPGGAVSENGRLCRGNEAHGQGDHRWNGARGCPRCTGFEAAQNPKPAVQR